MLCVTVIRSASLRGFRALVAELGGHAEDLANAAGVSAAALDTDDMMIPSDPQNRLLRAAAAELNCPDFGLRLAARQDLTMLGSLALAIRSCATIAEALECAARYLFLHSPTISLSVEDDPYGVPGVAALRNSTQAGDGPDPGVDQELGVIHRVLADLVGGRYGLRSVELPYRPSTPVSAYEEFFQAPVNFDAPAAMLRIPRHLLTRTLPSGGDAYQRQLIEALLRSQHPRSEGDLAATVRVVIEQSLGTAGTDLTATAHILGVHPRTLQRRLANANTSYASLLDDARRHAARRYLTDHDIPMTQVADLLGLSEQSALTRCCKRWWGITPSQVRRAGGRSRMPDSSVS